MSWASQGAPLGSQRHPKCHVGLPLGGQNAPQDPPKISDACPPGASWRPLKSDQHATSALDGFGSAFLVPLGLILAPSWPVLASVWPILASTWPLEGPPEGPTTLNNQWCLVMFGTSAFSLLETSDSLESSQEGPKKQAKSHPKPKSHADRS